MYTYYGYFDEFNEMGSGTSFYFREEKSKHLSGYEQLELAYFFKIRDTFTLIANEKSKKPFETTLTFKYDSKRQCIIPNEVDMKTLKKWISENKMVVIQSEKELFKEYFIVKAEGLEINFMKEEITRLLNSKKIPEKFKKIHSNITELEHYFKILCPAEDFVSYLVSKQDFLFGESPINIILTNRSEHLINWFKDRV